MKTRKYSLISLLALVMVTFFALAMTACDFGRQPAGTTDKGEAGIYYTDAKDGEWTVSLAEGKFTLNASSDTKYGSYIYGNDKTITLTDTKSNSKITGTLENGKLILDYKGGKVLFNKKIDYVVTFRTGDDTTTQTVTNGKCAKKPADPQKDGYQFIGWYADEAFTAGYDFASPVTANTTVYGRMEKKEIGQNEYNVTFVVDGEEVKTAKTVNGVCYGLYTPTAEGKEFLGWWTSDFDSAEQLTAKYNGEKLAEDTNLYAVWKDASKIAISVNAGRIEWSAVSGAARYTVEVTGPEGALKAVTPSVTYTEDYDFTKEKAGKYEITVTATGGVKGKAYFNNAALNKVSGLKVIGNKLVWNAVEGADYYVVNVVCGNAEHKHTDINNGKSTNFDFGACTMTKDGIRLSVTACANGKANSVAATYVLVRNLPAVTAVKVDETGDKVIWNAVEGAEYYLVTVKSNGNVLGTERAEGVNYAYIDNYNGNLDITVTAYASGYNASVSEEINFERNKLATPVVTVSNKNVQWAAIKDAVGYVVTVNGKSQEVKDTIFNLATAMQDDAPYYAVTVKALAENAANNSAESKTVYINANKFSSVYYADGKVIWEPIANARTYGVKVNSKAEVKINADVASEAAVKFEQRGKNTVTVVCYDAGDNALDTVTVEVTAYALYFNAGEGSDCETQYKAVGDTVTLPESTRDGYVLAGWFSTPAGLSGVSQKYEDGYVYSVASDSVLYADWTTQKYKVTLVTGAEGELDDDEKEQWIYYLSEYKLPVPRSLDETKVFAGWYTAENGGGTQLTDADGTSTGLSQITAETTIYACWSDLLTTNDTITDEGERAYAVSAGPGIRFVKEVTIPEYIAKVIDGETVRIPVITINAGAFKDCRNLEVINFYSSITTVDMGGSDGTNSPFQGCSSLREVNVLPSAEKVEKQRYFSTRGMLVGENRNSGKSLILFAPARMSGVVEIPAEANVDVISTAAFAGKSIETIHIPYTVSEIEEGAFAKCYRLVNVIFDETPADVVKAGKTVPLYIGADVFNGCYDLEELNLPARLKSFESTSFSATSYLKTVSIVAANGEDYLAYSSGRVENGKYVEYGYLFDKKGETVVFVPKGREGELVIPEGVKTIASNAFSGSFLTKVTIPSTVTEIKPYAFSGTASGEPYGSDADGSVSYQGTAANRLTEVIFLGKSSSQPLTIGEGAFYGAKSIKRITLPGNLYKLDSFAFGNTKALTDVTLTTSLPEAVYASGAFADKDGNYYVKNLVIGDSVPFIEVCGIFGSKNLEKITVGNNPNFSTESDGEILFDKNKTTIIYYAFSRKDEEYVIPETVTKISEGVFAGKYKLKKITIGSKVESIGKNAFADCTALEEVSFAKTASGTDEIDLTIGDRAFYNCPVLKVVEIPARTTEIGVSCFEKCVSLTEITVPEGVTAIGDGTFNGCSELVVVNLPSTLEMFYVSNDGVKTSVEDLTVFSNCAKLAEINITAGNEYFVSYDGILCKAEKVDDKYVARTVLCSPAAKTGVVTLPATITRLGDNSFNANVNITEIKFEEGTEDTELTFGKNVFTGCSKLTTFNLPVGMKTIKQNMFYGCTALKTVVVPYTVESIENGAFSVVGTNGVSARTFSGYTGNGLTSIEFMPTPAGKTEVPLVLENGVYYSSSGSSGYSTYYLDAVFGYTNITSITLPERTTAIGDYAFVYLKITSINIPANVTRIGQGAFYNCKSLQTVTFGENSKLEAIPANCFSYDSKLKNIDLTTTNIKSIGYQAFSSCTALTSITVPASTETLGSQYYMTGSSNVKVTMVDITNLISVRYAEILAPTMRDFAGSCFASCSGLTEVTFEKDEKSLNSDGSKKYPYGTALKTIGSSAFSSCKVLESITIPASTEEILEKAFTGCVKISSVTFDTYDVKTVVDGTEVVNKVCNLAEIGDQAFYQVGNSVTSKWDFVFPESETGKIKLGKSLFNGCTKINSITLSKSIKELVGVLYGCKATLNQGESDFVVDKENNFVYDIVNSEKRILALVGDPKVGTGGTYTIPAGYTVIMPQVFQGRNTIKVLTIPASVKKIGSQAFNNCTGLTTVVFEDGADNPSQLTYMGAEVFGKCTNLTTANIPGNLGYVPDGTFTGCKRLANVTLGEGIKTIGYVGVYDNYARERLSDYYDEIDLGVYDSFSYTGTSGSNVFSSCTLLKKLTLPESLERLGSYLFYSSGLESIEISKNVTAIGIKPEIVKNYPKTNDDANSSSMTNGVFQGASSLKTVTFANGSKLVALYKYAFNGCKALSSIELPSTCKIVADGAFTNCEKLETIDLTDVTELGSSAFYGCKALVSVTLGEGIKTLEANTFKGCKSLETIDLTHVVSLGTDVFNGCADFTSVQESNTLKFDVENNKAYYYDSGTKINGTTIVKSEDGKTVTKSGKTYHVGVDCYIRTSGKTEYVHILTNTLDVDGKNSFFMYVEKSISNKLYLYTVTNGLKSVILGEEIAELPNNAFTDCLLLQSINTENVSVLGSSVFANCYSLKILDLSKVTTIGSQAFASSGVTNINNTDETRKVVDFSKNNISEINEKTFVNSSFEYIKLPQGVTLHNYAFLYSDLKEIDLRGQKLYSGSQSDGNYYTGVFRYSYKLEGVVLDDDTNYIPDYTFGGCSSLKTIDLGKIVTIGKYAFEDCVELENVDTSNVEAVMNAAFDGCVKLVGIRDNETSKLNLSKAVVIDSNAFLNCTSIVEVDLSSANEFGTYAFSGCTSLEKVVLPESLDGVKVNGKNVRRINSNVFYNCTSLYSVTLPKDIEEINSGLFRNTAITSITIPSTVTELGQSAFDGCENLVSVKFESGSRLAAIGKYAFDGCSSLNNISVPDSVSKILDCAFRYCSNITEFAIPANLTEIVSTAFVGSGIAAFNNDHECPNFNVSDGILVDEEGTIVLFPPQKVGVVTISENLKLAKDVFRGNDVITKIEFADGYAIEEIPEGAFAGLGEKFLEVDIPATVKTIGEGAFRDCEKLAMVNFLKDENGKCALETIGEQAFRNCPNIETMEIPSSVKTIGSYSFAQSGIKRITIPGSVETIKDNAFWNSKLSSVTFNEGLQTIETDAFENTDLSEVELPNSLTTFANGVFSGTKIKSIRIPDGITTLNSGLFNGYTKLIDIDFNKVDTIIMPFGNAGSEKDANEKFVVTIPSTVKEITGTSSTNSAFSSSYIDEVVLNIPATQRMFRGAKNIKKVTFNVPLTEIPAYIFYDCESLTEFTIPSTVTAIGDRAFANSGIESIVIPATVKEFGSYIFGAEKDYTTKEYKTQLKTATLENGLTAVPERMFNGCDKLETVVLPATIETIGNGAFYDAASLKNITLPNGLKSIGNLAFDSCNSIESLILPKGISLGSDCFRNWTKEQTVYYRGSATDEISVAGASEPTQVEIGYEWYITFNTYSSSREELKETSERATLVCDYEDPKVEPGEGGEQGGTTEDGGTTGGTTETGKTEEGNTGKDSAEEGQTTEG